MNACIQCKQNYIKNRANSGNFCSRKCYWESMKGKVPQDGKIAGGRKGIPLSEDGKQKMRIKMLGNKNSPTNENHFAYVKNRYLVTERTGRKYWAKQVKARDRHTCRIANNDCKGQLEAHHILNWKEHPTLRFDINNGITLCHAHHPKGAEEKRLIPTFQELVSVSNSNT